MNEKYLFPVCGHDGLEEEAFDFTFYVISTFLNFSLGELS